jgi:hypothetical protein
MLYCAGLLLMAVSHGGAFAPCSAQTARSQACAPRADCAVSLRLQDLSPSIGSLAGTWPSKFYAEVERSFVNTLDRTYVRGVARTGAFLVKHILFLD